MSLERKNLEIERKYLNVDFEQLRARLAEIGAKNFGAHFEINLLFDFKDQVLFGQNKLLRLRINEWPDRIARVLTFKGPSLANSENFKMREEIECEIGDANSMREILLAAGFIEVARYEKIREEFELASFPQVQIVLDSLPFGNVVELEGEPENCMAVEKTLSLDKYPTSTESYHGLHQKWRRQNGLEPETSFVFAPQRRMEERKKLGLA